MSCVLEVLLMVLHNALHQKSVRQGTSFSSRDRFFDKLLGPYILYTGSDLYGLCQGPRDYPLIAVCHSRSALSIDTFHVIYYMTA